MAGCNSCKNLKEKDRKEGNLGAVYFCSKKKTYVSGASVCDDYSEDIMRKTFKRDEIYRDGIKFSNDKTPIGAYVFVLIILVVLGLILGVFW
jgi:hypothetical protein